jgi:tetratricopeptide (TPR) repeat protein
VVQSDRSSSQEQPADLAALKRAIRIVLLALVAVLLLGGGYYLLDRYRHPQERSPVEVGIAHLEEVVRDEPDNVDARVALADAYLGGGQYKQALGQTEQVLALYPDAAGALLIAGIAHARMDRPQDAVEPLEYFVSLRKDSPMARMDTALEAAYYFLGESYVKLGHAAGAAGALEAALEISPTDADAHYMAGEARRSLGQMEQALAHYRQATRFVPNFAEAYEGMVEAYTALGRSDHTVYALGMSAYSRNDFRTAQAYLEQASEKLPEFAPAFTGLGLTYEKLGRLNEAASTLQQALELEPHDFAAQQALGRVEQSLSSRE